MKNREYQKVKITKKGELALINGHPWVYEGEVTSIDDNIKNGDLVDVISSKDKYLGIGFYNNNSKIRVRIISRNTNDTFDAEFFKRRIKYAFEYRKIIMGNDLNCCRIIFGEADGLPGLTVDKYNNILVCQILCLGIELRKNLILPLIKEVLDSEGYLITGIYEREDETLRTLEGLEEYKRWYLTPKDNKTTTQIIENDLNYLVDFENGQKTGFFLDQKYNRLLVKKISKDKNVLDCCTHTGSFAMNAYAGGAKKVTAMDISPKALEDAQANFALNNMKISTKCGDVFEVLENLAKSKTKEYDFIILDPPAFTKSRKTKQNALKGYEEINYLAMKSLPRGGLLATASCSHFAFEKDFKQAIFRASLRANVSLKEISFTKASPDHPILWGVPETEYLKFFIFQVS